MVCGGGGGGGGGGWEGAKGGVFFSATTQLCRRVHADLTLLTQTTTPSVGVIADVNNFKSAFSSVSQTPMLLG